MTRAKQKQIKAIDKVLDRLRPNIFTPDHNIWLDLRDDLRSMTAEGLERLATAILCKKTTTPE